MRVLALLGVAVIAAAAYKLMFAPGHAARHGHVLLSGRDLVIAAGITLAAVITCVLAQNTTR